MDLQTKNLIDKFVKREISKENLLQGYHQLLKAIQMILRTFY